MRLTGQLHHVIVNLRQRAKARTFLSLGSLFVLSTALSTPLISLRADESFDDTDYIAMLEERERGVGWNISPGISGGQTTPLHGYPEYPESYNGAIDVYFRPPIPQFPTWTTRMAFRLSGEYFALEVPEEVKGITQDLYGLTGTVLYRFVNFEGRPEDKRIVPFVGAGLGVYWDRISIDHPATGKKTGMTSYIGYTGSTGIMLPAFGNLRIIPEVRYHALDQWKVYWASHLTYQIGLVYWIPARVSE